MQKYITRDKIADFVAKMWDAGIRCDLKPDQSSISLWSRDLEKVEYVDVVSKRTYDSLVDEVINSLGEKYDPSHITNVQ